MQVYQTLIFLFYIGNNKYESNFQYWTVGMLKCILWISLTAFVALKYLSINTIPHFLRRDIFTFLSWLTYLYHAFRYQILIGPTKKYCGAIFFTVPRWYCRTLLQWLDGWYSGTHRTSTVAKAWKRKALKLRRSSCSNTKTKCSKLTKITSPYRLRPKVNVW